MAQAVRMAGVGRKSTYHTARFSQALAITASCGDPVEALLVQRNGIIVVRIVHSDNRLPARHERLASGRTGEASGAVYRTADYPAPKTPSGNCWRILKHKSDEKPAELHNPSSIFLQFHPNFPHILHGKANILAACHAITEAILPENFLSPHSWRLHRKEY